MLEQRNVLSNSTYGPIIINRFDTTIGASISKTGYWGRDDITLLEGLLRVTCDTAQPMCLLDIGSNIGTHALAFAKYPFAQVEVHAFEAQREIYLMLAGTMALNNLSNVFCHHNAVTNRSGDTLNIRAVDYGRHGNFGMFEVEAVRYPEASDMYIEGRFNVVRTLRVDDLQLKNVRLIKVDVEGMEDKVIAGAAETIAAQRPIMFIETCKTDFDSVKDFLVAHDYLAFGTRMGDAICLPKEHNVGVNGTTRLL